VVKNILFDFDGVILDSMPIRDYGFKKIFEYFDDALVSQLLNYNNENGGLSRYVKIKYFYNEILDKEILEEEIDDYASNFSKIMKKELVNKKYLIVDTLEFIKNNFKKYNLHIVSGSDERELKYLCKKLEIDKYFQSINGSPTEKNKLVESVLLDNEYLTKETILIGDSINDYVASEVNGIDFYGFNNTSLINISEQYLENYKGLV
jgi:HAD superfamily hydrolase (TIGR01549 family)